jgi:F-type H+-transporting ATPase subunit gamma
MAALQGIKRRIRSVSSTRQITKAMQLVAASKLRHAQEAATGSRDYTTAARQLLSHLAGGSEASTHPLYQTRPVKRGLMVVIAGDRGLAGAYNSNVLKSMARHVTELGVPQQAICIGRYAALHVSRLKDVDEIAAYDIDHGHDDIQIARPVLADIMRLFTAGEVDTVHLVSTKYISTVKQELAVIQLVPVQPEIAAEPQAQAELEPDPVALLEVATQRVLEGQLVQAIRDARASEQASRMLAMMNATDNAKELIEDLTLTFNDARQAAITQELAEISGGAEAISQAGV